MKSMSIKSKVILIIATCLLLGAVALIGFVNRSYKQNVNLVARQSLSAAQKSYRNLELTDYRALKMTCVSLMNDTQMRDLFLKHDRDALLAYSKPVYERLKEHSGISIFTFVEPDKTVFLRVLTPKKHSDLLKMKVVDDSVATKSIAVGSEMGKAGYALRCTLPYYDKSGKIFGYMLMGDTYDSFLSTMKTQSGDDYVMVGDKKLVDEKKYHQGQQQKHLPDMWNEFKNVIVLTSTFDYGKKNSFDSEIKSIPADGKVLGEVRSSGKVYVRGVFPLVDMSGKQIGGVFVTHDITQMYMGMQQVQKSAVAAIVALMLVISLTLVSVLNRLIFARLRKTMDVATRVVGGEFQTQIVPESDDEVGQLESLLEQFRTVFVSVADELERRQSEPEQLKKSA